MLDGPRVFVEPVFYIGKRGNSGDFFSFVNGTFLTLAAYLGSINYFDSWSKPDGF